MKGITKAMIGAAAVASFCPSTHAISFNFVKLVRLPESAGAISSRLDALAWDAAGDGCLGVGRCFDAMGISNPVVWTNSAAIPVDLPTLGFGGTPHDLAISADHEITLACGSVLGPNGENAPALWVENYDDGTWGLYVPAIQGNYIGADIRSAQVVAIEGINFFFAAGHVIDAAHHLHAAVWSGVDPAALELKVLPGAGSDRSSSAAACGFKLANVYVSGFVVDANGTQHATYWEEVGGEWSSPMILPGIAPARGSAALGLRDGLSNTVFCGWAESSTTELVPTFWLQNGAVTRTAVLPDGFNQGRANGIIAVLIGLFVATGDINGDGLESAALFYRERQGQISVIDLNAVNWATFPSSLQRVTSASGGVWRPGFPLQFEIGGTGVSSDGLEHAWVGSFQITRAGELGTHPGR